ncbi:MAG: hypothetical protein LC676_12235 [Loktanella sp.]|nr:hypothetical protein [Loktanella sp.]
MTRNGSIYILSITVIAVCLGIVALAFLPNFALFSTTAAVVFFLLLVPGAVTLIIAAGFGFGPRTAPFAFHWMARGSAVWTVLFSLLLWTVL